MDFRYGVGGVLINKDKKIFIAKRIGMENNWQMPQGGIEKDENIEKAIFREMKEEIGTDNFVILNKTPMLQYEFPSHMQKSILDGKYIGQKQIWFFLLFNGNDKDINLNYHSIPEFDEWCWVNKTELLENVVYFKKEMYTQILLIAKQLNIL